MSNEIALSLEETNKLRARIGLDPIPLESNKKSTSVADSTSSLSLLPRVKEKHGEISLSLENTNKLRLSLGLNPIPDPALNKVVSKTENNDHRNERKGLENQSSSVERVNASNNKVGTSLNKDSKSSTSDENDINVSKGYDLESWISRVGTGMSNDKEASKVKTATKRHSTTELDGIEISHTQNSMSVLKDNDVLVWEDSNILDDNSAKLINTALVSQEKLENTISQKEKIKNRLSRSKHALPSDILENTHGEGDDSEYRIKIQNSEINTRKNSDPSDNSIPKYSEFFSEIIQENLPKDVGRHEANKPITKMKKMKKNKNASKSRNKSVEKPEVIDTNVAGIIDLTHTDSNDILEEENALKNRLKQSRGSMLLKRSKITPEELASEISDAKRFKEAQESEAATIKTHIKDSKTQFNDIDNFLTSINHVQKEKKNGSMDTGTNPAGASAEPVEFSDHTNQSVGLANHTNEATEVTTTSIGSIASTLRMLKQNSKIESNSDNSKAEREYRKSVDLFKFNLSIEERLLRSDLQNDKDFLSKPKEERESLFKDYLEVRLTEKGIIPPSIEDFSQNPSTHYDPKVSLTYMDESGETLNSKAAFKFLSHKFHGNGMKKSKK